MSIKTAFKVIKKLSEFQSVDKQTFFLYKKRDNFFVYKNETLVFFGMQFVSD